MREITVNEIGILEEAGCHAEDWTEISVDDDFCVTAVKNVQFYGHVEIGSLNGVVEVEDGFLRRCCIQNATLRNVSVGDECLIENVRGYISGYAIGSNTYISDCGIISAQPGAAFGQGETISVLNEGGDGNIVLSPELTSQTAWLMVNYPEVCRLAQASVAAKRPDVASIGSHCRIVGCKDVANTLIGDAAELKGVTRLSNCTVGSTDDASTFIGADVIMANSIVAPGATVTDGAKVMDCFVGESVHIGKGFSAEASIFFANSYMDNGEACAAFCGPFSTSHHKSTLLIGGAFSFYNAGSGTNQSNHAYKMGPIHWGTLARGSKTASGSHILWPATIGAFSMVMGKIETHPNLRRLPFSYVIAKEGKTYVVPGINIKTVGTWRDVGKWPKRDLRPQSSRRDLINFAFPNPYIIQSVLEGKELLLNLEQQQGKNVLEYEYKGCHIRRTSLVNGIQYYDLIIRLYLWQHFQTSDTEGGEKQSGTWLDLCGMLAPKVEIDRVIHDVRTGSIASIDELERILADIHADYRSNASAYAQFVMQHVGGNMFVDQDYWLAEAEKAHTQWLAMVRADAEKEYQMGDVDEVQLREFLEKVK